jgi:hypothetical protein
MRVAGRRFEERIKFQVVYPSLPNQIIVTTCYRKILPKVKLLCFQPAIQTAPEHSLTEHYLNVPRTNHTTSRLLHNAANTHSYSHQNSVERPHRVTSSGSTLMQNVAYTLS